MNRRVAFGGTAVAILVVAGAFFGGRATVGTPGAPLKPTVGRTAVDVFRLGSRTARSVPASGS